MNIYSYCCVWRALYEDCFCVYAHDIETAMPWKSKCYREKVCEMRDAILRSSWDAEDSNMYTWQIQKIQSLVVSPQALCTTTILYHESLYCFYLLPPKIPKNTCQNFLSQKNSWNRRFKPRNIPVTLFYSKRLQVAYTHAHRYIWAPIRSLICSCSSK